MMPSTGMTVLIVDDHVHFRASARAILETEGFTVIGEAQDAQEAIETVEKLRPNIVLLDVQLPDLDGFMVAERIAAGVHLPAIVLMSNRAAATYAMQLTTTPARGFIAKWDLSGAALAALVR